MTNAYRISQADFDDINRRSRVDRWDVLVSMIGTVGEPCLVRDEPDFAIKNIGLFKSKDEVHGRWLYYYLRSPDARRLFRELSRGTTQAYIPLSALRDFPVVVPANEDEMRVIVRILGSLDDRIDLNRRMNETLEAIAQAIFKSWFVDFDPVRTKAEGRPPAGMDTEAAALFPDALTAPSPAGLPVGWQVRPIGDVARVVGGTTPSTEEPAFWDGGDIGFATPRDLSGLPVPVLVRTERCITEAGLTRIPSGLLPRGTVLMSSRAPVGYLALADLPVAVNQGMIAMVCDGPLPNYYVLHWARANMAAIESRTTGTTFGEVTKRDFRPLPCLVPPAPALAAFTHTVAPLYERMALNLRERDTLAALRDTLLPKLMSGEVRVRDVEQAAGATV